MKYHDLTEKIVKAAYKAHNILGFGFLERVYQNALLSVKSVKSVSKTKPNWLLRSLVAVSLCIHLAIFMHVTKLYSSNTLAYIELALQDISKPPTRSIPRPHHRPKEPPRPQNVKRLKITQRSMPQFKPIKLEPAEKDLPDSLVEAISMPDAQVVSGLHIAAWNPGETSGAYAASHSYLEMVRLKIERYKEYPDMARISHIEGRVTVWFVITPEGHIREATVVKTSTHKALDTAALKAVQDASPFPRPPRRLFKGEIPLELTIFFELT